MSGSQEGRVASGWSQTPLSGVWRRSLVAYDDARGSFRELWRASWTEGLTDQPFVQANLSRSARGVLRGMHFHRRQADLWVLAEGRAFVALADLHSAADGRGPQVFTLEMQPGDAILIPTLVAHGFHALEPIALVYLVTGEYDGSDELGFRWDDPQAAIPWPNPTPTLSERDARNPPLAGALADLSRP